MAASQFTSTRTIMAHRMCMLSVAKQIFASISTMSILQKWLEGSGDKQTSEG